MSSGLLIVLEGVDGAGKSTLQAGLQAFFEALGRTVLLSREPTAGPNGQALRDAAKIKRLPAEQELALLLADRREHVRALINPALAAGKIVILDRYYYSTVAYQGAAGLDRARVLALNEAFAPKPDALLILDLPVPDALTRIATRGAGQDDFERADTLSFVRNCFLSFADLPFAHVLDACSSPAALCGAACAKLFPLLTKSISH
jgi:dTMP kinase